VNMTLEEAKVELQKKVDLFKDQVYIPLCVQRAAAMQPAADALNAAALAVHEADTVEEINRHLNALDQFAR